MSLVARKAEKAPSENDQPSHTNGSTGEGAFIGVNFFRDLKKVAKKQDRPSQRNQERR
jgi:hypothetical protein